MLSAADVMALSDEELAVSLAPFIRDVPPVTDTTRLILRQILLKHLKLAPSSNEQNVEVELEERLPPAASRATTNGHSDGSSGCVAHSTSSNSADAISNATKSSTTFSSLSSLSSGSEHYGRNANTDIKASAKLNGGYSNLYDSTQTQSYRRRPIFDEAYSSTGDMAAPLLAHDQLQQQYQEHSGIPDNASPTPKTRSSLTWLLAILVACGVLYALVHLDPWYNNPVPTIAASSD